MAQAIIQHQGGAKFAALARRYCDLLAKATQVEASELPRQAAMLLAGLYCGVMQLRDSSVAGSDAATAHTEPWPPEHRATLATALGAHDYYWVVSESQLSPYVAVTPSMGSLVDDLDGIAADLWHGLALLEGGAPMQSAISSWSWTFRTHWGTHLVQALAAIHALIRAKE